MSRFKFGNKHIYEVPGVTHKFNHLADAQFYCKEHQIDVKSIVKYDSKKEHDRWLCLQMLQSDGLISELRRQVEFELIPAKTETVKVKDKVINDWIVENEHFATKKDAHAYCRSRGLQYAAALCQRRIVEVFKEVVIEHNAVYTADFVYKDADGNLVVEDTKSEITRKEPDYVLRRKLMLHVHGIRILET